MGALNAQLRHARGEACLIIGGEGTLRVRVLGIGRRAECECWIHHIEGARIGADLVAVSEIGGRSNMLAS